MTYDEQLVYNYFLNKGFTKESIAGIMGNIYKESKFKFNNLQDSFNKSLNMTDEQYTFAVDNNIYQNFTTDKAGYGIVQWTYKQYKIDLLNYCKSKNKSISDKQCQLEQLYSHLQSEGLLNKLKSMTSIEKATEYFMLQFEKPKDQSQSAIDERIGYAKIYYQGGNNKMKYSNSNPPLICMQTNSTCFRNTNKMKVVGVLWHSTGANNNTLKRYIQPSENDPNYSMLINMIGVNPNHNDWNHISIQAGLNAWIGTLANGQVTTIQTMPWDYKPWGCGSGSKGSCNNGWIQFEIAEDGLTDQRYFEAVYKEACELTAYLCKLYNIDPFGNVNGIPTILCHQDSYRLGMGTNHSDVYHWFNKYNKTMDNVRQDVATLLGVQATAQNTGQRTLQKGIEDSPEVKALQESLQKLGYNLIADGDFGPITDNALKDYQKKHGLTPNGIFGPETFTVMKAELSKLPAATSTQSVSTQKYNDVMLGSSSKDERGQYTGGQAGDQTGKEVYVLNWYGKNWTSVLRPKSNELAERIASACEAGCNNNYIGYSQSTRNTLLTEAKKVGLDLSKITTPCNCDCSSFVSTCCVCAGLPESIMFPWGNGCTTHTMAEQCLATGQFVELTGSQYTNQKDNLKRGDILLNRNSHVVIVLSNGINVPEVKQIQPYLVQVTEDILNVRTMPNAQAQVIAQINKGQVFTIIAEEGGYGKLKSGIGWIDLSYTKRR